MPYENTSQKRGLYIIGYFMVDEILDFKGMTDAERVKCRRRFPNNAHMKRADEVDELVIVVGKRRKSRLLDKAVLISQPKADRRGRPYMALSDEMEGMLGVSGGIQRSIPPRFIRGQKYLESLRQILHYN